MRTSLISDPSLCLTEVPPGTTVTLREARVDAATRGFLRSLGLTDRSPLRVCQHGDPCIIQVRSTRIGLSRSVAGRIFVNATPTTQDR
jgi:Fe2+ transport system protein FeoA